MQPAKVSDYYAHGVITLDTVEHQGRKILLILKCLVGTWLHYLRVTLSPLTEQGTWYSLWHTVYNTREVRAL